MNLLKDIAARIYAVYALVLFLASLLIASPASWSLGLWPEPRRSQLMYRIMTVWMDFFFFVIGIRREIKGKQHFKKGENYIVVCNHRSFMDVPLCSPSLQGPNKTIAKVEMSRIPLFGIVYKRGSVLVDRKSEESRRMSYNKMKEVLEMGIHMCIYPEGTRNKTSEPLQRFHDGAFKLAVETGKSIIPALIFGTNDVMPTERTFYLWPKKLRMHYLPPVSPENRSVKELKEMVFEQMYAYYTAHRQ